MPTSSKQDEFVADLKGDGWRVKAITTTPLVETLEDGTDVAGDGDGPIRVVVVNAKGIERRYDVDVDGRSDEIGLSVGFGPHQNPALKG